MPTIEELKHEYLYERGWYQWGKLYLNKKSGSISNETLEEIFKLEVAGIININLR